MQEIVDVLADASKKGVRLWADNGLLKYRAPPGVMDDALRESLRRHRDNLIRYLAIALDRDAPTPALSDPPTPCVIAMPAHIVPFWRLIQRGEAGIAYSNGSQLVFHFDQPMDAEAILVALGRLVVRHEILAARVVPIAGEDEGFVCDVTPRDILSIEDLSAHGDAADEVLAGQIRAFVWAALDPARALASARFFRLDDQRSALALVVHHFIVDDASMNVVGNDLIAIFQEIMGVIPLAPRPAPPQYTTYLRDMGRRLAAPNAFASERRFFSDQMRGAPATHLRYDLQFDAHSDGEMLGHRFHIEPGLIDRLDIYCRSRRATLAMGMLTVTRMVLASMIGRDDIVLTLLVDGRQEGIAPDVVGRFSNLLPLRTLASRRARFVDALDETRLCYLNSLPHWNCPQFASWGDVAAVGQAWDSPMINFRDATTWHAGGGDLPKPDDAEHLLPGGKPPPWRSPAGSYPNFHLTLFRTSGGLSGHIQYHDRLHNASTMSRFCNQFVMCVEACVATPDQPYLARSTVLAWDDGGHVTTSGRESIQPDLA